MTNCTQDSWECLFELLGDMRLNFENFLSLLQEEEFLLHKMERQRMVEVTEKKEQVLDAICRYEQQVVVVLQQLAGPKNQERLGAWLQNTQQPEASTANTLLHDLSALTQTIHEQGKKNAVLIGRTQHVVREAINLIYTGLGKGPVYQGSGTLQFPSVLSSVHLHG